MSEIEVHEPSAVTPGTNVIEPPVTALAPFSRWVTGIGGVLFAVLMALSGRYGFHHDELYFLDCGRHLQASYVDQPVFTRCGPGSRSRPSACHWPACGCGPRWPRGAR